MGKLRRVWDKITEERTGEVPLWQAVIGLALGMLVCGAITTYFLFRFG